MNLRKSKLQRPFSCPFWYHVLICFIFFSCNKAVDTKVTDYSTDCFNNALELFDRYEISSKQYGVLGHAYGLMAKGKDSNNKHIGNLKEGIRKQSSIILEISKLPFFSKSTDEKVRKFITADEKYVEAHKESIAKLIRKDANNYFEKCTSTYEQWAKRCSGYDEFSEEYKNCELRFNDELATLANEFKFYNKASQLDQAPQEIEKLKSEMLIDVIKKIKSK